MIDDCLNRTKLNVPKVAKRTKPRRPEQVDLVINSRPASFKNNRRLTSRGGKLSTFKSSYAIQAIEAAKWELKSQWKGKASKECWDIEVKYYYKDRKSWLDPDGAYAFVLDCLKGIVIHDDSNDYIGDSILRKPQLSRIKKDHIEITLSKFQTLDV